MGRLGRRIKLTFAIAALFLLSACAGNQLVMSGTALDTIGQSFVTTANLYNSLHDAGKITDDEYRAFAVFAKQFKVIYPVAVDTWKAVESNPELAEGKQAETLTNQILKLKQQLIEYYSFSLGKLEVQ
ncbi:hypothetical protein LCGC14_1213230 [marine sediment metagenome]|uniref:Uncharacterized protein n=1 Tax=marine sediment metagenome TaxID=412755 RepID=A0A0F9LDE5_9ZZZZ